MHLNQIPCLRLLALDTRFDSASMCNECMDFGVDPFMRIPG
jgi:hypothetical protein